MSSCIDCLAENHWECSTPVASEDSLDSTLSCCCSLVGSAEVPLSILGAPPKAPEDMKDPMSTGRKRAALAKPIEKGMVCEWRKLRFAGGGVIPIIGCAGNPASDIHHGPDKDVLNNADANLHRLCDTCHNRWHTLNDPFYGARPTPGTPFVPIDRVCLPHDDTTKADLRLVFDSEMWWAKPIPEREKYWNEPTSEIPQEASSN